MELKLKLIPQISPFSHDTTIIIEGKYPHSSCLCYSCIVMFLHVLTMFDDIAEIELLQLLKKKDMFSSPSSGLSFSSFASSRGSRSARSAARSAGRSPGPVGGRERRLGLRGGAALGRPRSTWEARVNTKK